MRAFRLFTALLFILTSYTCEAQFPWLVKAFVKEATETAVTRSTINYFNKTAASKFVTHELENFATKNYPRQYPKAAAPFEIKPTKSISEILYDGLNTDQMKTMDQYLAMAKDIEKNGVSHTGTVKKSLTYLNGTTTKAKITVKPSIPPLFSEEALAYSDDALEVQEELKRRGYRVRADGRFSNETKEALAKALKRLPLRSFPHEQALEIATRDLFNNYKSKFIRLRKSDFLNGLEFNHNNQLVVSHKIAVKDQKVLKEITDFHNSFYNNFKWPQSFKDSRFVTVYKTETESYVGCHFKKTGEGLYGGLFDIKTATPEKKSSYLEIIFKDPAIKKVYVYGDDISDIDKAIHEEAVKHNVAVIYQNTKSKRSFNKTEIALRKLTDKKITGKRLTFLNGSPNSREEAVFQSFNIEHVESLKSLHTELNNKISVKTATVIQTKGALIKELTTGSNDFMFIIAHCDGENIYFGSNVLSISELNKLPRRINRANPRTAILFSCTSGDIYKTMLTKNDPKAFGELLLEKNFFDLIIAPPGTINGNDVLRMIDIVDKYPVLHLNKEFTNLLEKGQILNLAKTPGSDNENGNKNAVTINNHTF